MNELIITNDNASVRSYFETVYLLARQGEEFPIYLDQVWPLVYTEKANAVRALRRDFIETIDYKALVTNDERKPKNGGQNEMAYQLTLSCFEFFIARKIRQVFEVYRQFFHRALESPPQQISPATHILTNHDQRIADLEHQLKQMLDSQQQAARSLLEAPRSTELLPIETTRAKIQRLVNGYCRAKNVGQQEVWRRVYDRLYYLYRVSVRSYKRSERESWLDVAERNGHLEKIYAIVSAELLYTETP